MDLVAVEINVDRVRRNAEEIVRAVGVPVHAVVKANAYGLGACAVAEAIGDLVAGFCVFGIAEARQYRLWEISRKPILCIGHSGGATAEDFVALHARPAVVHVEQARAMRAASPALCVDTGMQRFACPAENVTEAMKAGECREAFTHAIRPEQVKQLVEITGGRSELITLHAAGSSLMNEAECRLDAVRPGMALYRGAVRMAVPLVEVRDGRGPAGYTGFETARHGVILRGYWHGLRAGPCLVNGRRTRVIEVGMQSAFIACEARDNVGDEVVLLGDGLEADEIAMAWKTGPQEVLVSLLRG